MSFLFLSEPSTGTAAAFAEQTHKQGFNQQVDFPSTFPSVFYVASYQTKHAKSNYVV